MNEITAGSIVKLRSGGPAMTVSETPAPGKFICHWFADSLVREYTFCEQALTIIGQQDQNISIQLAAPSDTFEKIQQDYSEKNVNMEKQDNNINSVQDALQAAEQAMRDAEKNIMNAVAQAPAIPASALVPAQDTQSNTAGAEGIIQNEQQAMQSAMNSMADAEKTISSLGNYEPPAI